MHSRCRQVTLTERWPLRQAWLYWESSWNHVGPTLCLSGSGVHLFSLPRTSYVQEIPNTHHAILHDVCMHLAHPAQLKDKQCTSRTSSMFSLLCICSNILQISLIKIVHLYNFIRVCFVHALTSFQYEYNPMYQIHVFACCY